MIPKQVKIGGRVYNVVFCQEVDEDNANTDGKILYSKREIRLKSGMDEAYTNEVLLHEIVHGVFNFLHFEQDENLVEKLTNSLYQVLADNNLKF